ncbi:hypothetical protein IFR09_13440 [Pseudomonas syringae]|nr:hypothetical protein [Pseudomonas syringae]MBD8789596.1 hypothetical protein [Pseudomonas syringae]MBD8800785.1 hypothetical protein [Pseudomonas syringae]MBD8812166.1 hypothetical protein [Pseudomonas syringae]
MSSDTSRGEIQAGHSARRVVGPLLMLWITAVTPMQTLAQEGVLAFRGQLVHSTCDLHQSRPAGGSVPKFQVAVQPGVFLEVNTHYNACSGEAVPFTTQFQAVSVTDGDPGGPAGVVTVTYQ